MYPSPRSNLHSVTVARQFVLGLTADRLNLELLQLPSLSVQNSYPVPDPVTSHMISPDERLIAGLTSARNIHIFRVDQTKQQFNWILDCKIPGVSSFRFSLNSRFLFVTAEFATATDIWSLKSRSIVHRVELGKGVLDETSELLAVASRAPDSALPLVKSGTEASPLQEYLSLFHIEKDTLSGVSQMLINTQDATMVKALEDGRMLVVDSPLYAKAWIYSAEGVEWCIVVSEGNKLGVKSVEVFGGLIGFGTWDGVVRIFAVDADIKKSGKKEEVAHEAASDAASPLMAPVHVRTFGQKQFVTSEKVTVFRETLATLPQSDIRTQLHVVGAEMELEVAYDKQELLRGSALTIPTTKFVKQLAQGEAPKVGISQMTLSGCGRFLATRADETANTVKVYEVSSGFQLTAVLQHRAPVRCVAWGGSRLAVATGEPRVFIVDIAEKEVTGIFALPVTAVRLDWSDTCLVVSGRDGVVALREVAGMKGG